MVRPLDADEKRSLRGLGALAACWTFLPALAGFFLLAKLGDASDLLRAIETDLGRIAAIAIFASFFAVTSGLGVLPTYAQAILAGWAFGATGGSVGAILGITAGAMVGFGLARLVSGERVQAIIDARPVVAAVRDAILGAGAIRATYIVGLLRLSPNSPFALSNLALGGARTPVMPYLLGTMFGMAPRTVLAAVFAAGAAADGSRDLAAVVRERGWSVTLAGVVVLVIAIVVIGSIGKRALRRALDAQEAASESS